MVIVIAEGAGQEYVAQEMQAIEKKDASGNRLLLDIGLWLSEKIKVYFYLCSFVCTGGFSLVNVDSWSYYTYCLQNSSAFGHFLLKFVNYLSLE